ncbi:hypothetical protein E2C01_085405 [Portunus trituberculatus]|uniref:Uncharacterized protein n=1 Tax=Portunus trituberculatus TaxID=210409 RepID=A0A5B7JBT9_PORTR|nr:hypothetical protein [Portunus trituberculatus]
MRPNTGEVKKFQEFLSIMIPVFSLTISLRLRSVLSLYTSDKQLRVTTNSNNNSTTTTATTV